MCICVCLCGFVWKIFASLESRGNLDALLLTHCALYRNYHCRCFPLGIGTVQIVRANFVGLLVRMLLMMMIQLFLCCILAVSVKKNVIMFASFALNI